MTAEPSSSSPAARRRRRFRPRRAMKVWSLRVGRAATGRFALPVLFAGSVVESTVLPWPIEFPLLAQMLRGRRHVMPAALAVTLGSVTGCVLAYIAGVYAYDAARVVFEGSGGAAPAAIAAARERAEATGAWAVFFAMMAPVPVQAASFAAGLAGVAPLPFVVAALTGRAIRYFSMAILVWLFGEEVMTVWRRLPAVWRWGGIAVACAAFLALFAWTVLG